jgi:glycosyltransferase involved in cell wall biosynthesis
MNTTGTSLENATTPLTSPDVPQPLAISLPDAERISSIPYVDVAIVIPAYNEEHGIEKGVAELFRVFSALDLTFQVIVVNDGSTDGTAKAAERTQAQVIHQRRNRGYGASLKKGIASSNSKWVVITDADGTYPANALPHMLELAKSADMVVGDRGAAMRNVPMIRKPAKFVLNSLANYLAERKINDLNSGLRVFRRTSLQQFVPLLPEGFSFTTTITLCMVCSGLEVEYVPITYGRRIGTSKIRPTDFFAFILLVLRVVMLFRPLRVFLPAGAILIAMGMAKLAYDFTLMNLSESAVLAILAGLGAWGLGLIADMISRINLRP